mgnify:CR=1 FL=1|jgi:hypothetical protein
MIERPTPLVIEAGPFHAAVRLSSRPDESIYLERPMPAQACALIYWLFETEQLTEQDVERIEKPNEELTALARLELRHRCQAGIMGRIIGILWSHPDYSLQALSATHATPEAFGEAVYQELHAARWTPDEIEALFDAALKICNEATNRQPNQHKIEATVTFGKARRAPATTPLSPPG